MYIIIHLHRHWLFFFFLAQFQLLIPKESSSLSQVGPSVVQSTLVKQGSIIVQNGS